MREACPPAVLSSTSPPEVEPEPAGWFARRVPARWRTLLLLATLGATAVTGRACLTWHVPLPFCLLRKLTGLPCPACGCTRSLIAWAHLDPMAALRFNPLAFLATVGVVLWAAASFSDHHLGTRWIVRARAVRQHQLGWRALGVLALLNWLYLCWTLPR